MEISKYRKEIVSAGLGASALIFLTEYNINMIIAGPITLKWVIAALNALGLYLIWNKKTTITQTKKTPFDGFKEGEEQ